MFVDSPVFANFLDEVVEDRTWRSGVEMVSRVNWSHVARVRRSLGLSCDGFAPSRLRQSSEKQPIAAPAGIRWHGLETRTAA